MFLFPKASSSALGPIQTLFQWVQELLLLGLNWLQRVTGCLPVTSAEVKNEWSCTSTPSHAFMAYTRIT